MNQLTPEFDPPVRHRRRILRTLGIAALPACIMFAPVAAQEIGIYHASARSDLAELASPMGAGAFVRIFPTGHTSLRLSYQRQSNTSGRTDRVCTVYIPVVDCTQEGVHTETRLHGAALSGGLRARPLSFLELELGAGVTMNRVEGRDETESGRTSTLFVQHTAQFGTLVQGSARVQPLRIPLTIEAAAGNHRLVLNACAEDEFRYDPYCGVANLRELRIGLGYDLRW
jgi:hypothetical protein